MSRSIRWRTHSLFIQLCLIVWTCLRGTGGISLPANEASSAANFLAQSSGDSTQDEAVTNALRAVSEQLERFNTLYVGKLEARMLSVATLMTNIDANIKNLQERAHVWDTFQLHVSAWNEQIKALDRKVALISRGQEQLSVLDGKVTQLLSTEAHLSRVASRLDDVDIKLAAVAKAVEESGQGSTPLLGEFAARGVLSTLKNIERKVEKVSAQIKSDDRHSHHHSGGGETGGRLVVRCQAPPTMEALLHDVAAKVDVLFDRLPEEDDYDMEELVEEGEGEMTRNGESALLGRVFRRLASPLRRTWKALESVERAVRSGEDATSALKDSQRDILTLANRTLSHALQGSECCLARRDADRSWRAETSSAIREFREILHNASLERDQLALHLDEIGVEHNASLCNSFSSREEEESAESDESDEKSVEADLTTSASIEDDETSTPSAPRWLCHEVAGPGAVTGVVDPLGDLVNEDQLDVTDDRDLLYCDQDTSGGGWTVVQRRGDYGLPRENFTRVWADYEKGFGDLNREFFSGLTFLHQASLVGIPLRLRIELSDFDNNHTFAEYSVFRVSGATAQYRLRVTGYSGNASDSLGAHDGVAFSTIDRDNDEAPECCPCAPAYGGGWWFYSCFEANLNGEWHGAGEDNSYFRGIIWEHWRGDYSLASAQMKIRPADFAPLTS